MKWKKNKNDVPENGSEEDYYDEPGYSPWGKNKRRGFGKKTFQKPDIPLGWIGAVLAVVVVLIFIVGPGWRDSGTAKKIQALEERVLLQEEQLARVEALGDLVKNIDENNKKIELNKKRFEIFEISASRRMEYLAKELSDIRDGSAGVKQTKAVKKAPEKSLPKTENILYHQVRAGDTLYAIGRKYGLTIDKLLQINKLSRNSKIYPGQKLIIKN